MDGDQPQFVDKDGERGRNRTYNLLIKSQLLCQLSYAPDTGITLRMPARVEVARANFSIVALRRMIYRITARQFPSAQMTPPRSARYPAAWAALRTLPRAR